MCSFRPKWIISGKKKLLYPPKYFFFFLNGTIDGLFISGGLHISAANPSPFGERYIVGRFTGHFRGEDNFRMVGWWGMHIS